MNTMVKKITPASIMGRVFGLTISAGYLGVFGGYVLGGQVATSHDHSDHNYIQAVKSRFVHINKSSTFSEHGIEIKGVETFHDKVSGAKKGKNIIYNFKIDGINVCHSGDLGHTLDSNLVKEIGNVDILLLPVGGGFTIDAFF